MDKLIEALQILRKYGNPLYPTSCAHDVLYITADINPDDVSEEDVKRLKELGFDVTDEEEDTKQFYSYTYGSF